MVDEDAQIDALRIEAPLNDKQKALRDAFVNEYVKDYDAFRACIRMGFLATFASDQAGIFMKDGYVLRMLAHIKRSAIVPNEEDEAEMLSNLREIALNGSSASARVSASKQYMEAKGYIKPDGGGDEAKTLAIIEALKGFAQAAPE